ncbi:ATPase [Halonotius terrestris]|uniref:ATPase n=1 Tax=Halonotius terrestris TaxID=2487750 RepID=A0A8J8TCT9_9EURY|nr:ATPase [Halonotius terrestris]TQQ82743.1 ATPase [Halonotius terrestris]
MKLLVAGDARVDAGKTTFAAGLLAALDSAVGFKPRAGNDYWYDHDDAAAALSDGRLYGKDVATMAAAGDTDQPEETLNPVHRLWRPTPDRTGMLGEAGQTFLIDRVTTPEGLLFVVNGVAEREGLLPNRVAESLPLDDAPRVETVERFNDVMTDRYLPAFERVTERIAATTPAVVESYADIALPVAGIDFDAVAVVGPTRVRLYDGSRYLKAHDVASGSVREGQLEERVDRVVEMIEPVSTHTLRPLDDDERGDSTRIADAYVDVYEALLDIALTDAPAARSR